MTLTNGVRVAIIAWVVLMVIVGALLFSVTAHAATEFVVVSPKAETRFCANNRLNADGSFYRSRAVLLAYVREVPCPETHLPVTSCAGWSLDHVRPLSRCGCDNVSNIAWMKDTIKSCPGTECKDRWELKVYSCAQGPSL